MVKDGYVLHIILHFSVPLLFFIELYHFSAAISTVTGQAAKIFLHPEENRSPGCKVICFYLLFGSLFFVFRGLFAGRFILALETEVGQVLLDCAVLYLDVLVLAAVGKHVD